jgi:hypothetical protein
MQFAPQIILATALCALSAISACGGGAPKKPEPIGMVAPSEPKSPETPSGQKPEITQGTFDLGGPCLPRGGVQRPALTVRQEQQLRANGDWESLIAGAKQDVRNDCSIPYRWERLFMALVSGHHYIEAVQVLNDMATNGFAMPHAVLSKANPSFLESKEFKEGPRGIEYAAREDEVRQDMQMAEKQLASMRDNDLPPNPFRHAGACPFECCTYREWKTLSSIQLHESIDSPKIIAEVPAGVSVTGMTGEVWVEPEPYAVLQDNGALKAGDVVFFLANIGEGYVNYWYQGKLNPDLGLENGLLYYSYEDCVSNQAKTRAACSIRKLRPGRTFTHKWWVKIRYEGKEGWVLNTGQFGNVDACG